LKEDILPDAKPGDVEAQVKDQLGSANMKVVIEELVSTLYIVCHCYFVRANAVIA
jgi:hypothetical protein